MSVITIKKYNIKHNICLQLSVLAFGIFLCSAAAALTFSISNNTDIVGSVEEVYSRENDSMYSIAREFDLGLLELIKANPNINPKQRLAPGTNILIPTAFILPPGPRNGIVLNLAELRIYYYHPGGNLVSTHPVGIGRSGWLTPVGVTRVAYKRANPTWTPPDSIRAHYAKKGKILPATIGPGPKNPLGAYAMNLAWTRFVIHGTNEPQSVGLRSSSGCIRMYPEDISALFHLVPEGTSVRVIHEAIKIGVSRNTVYLEAHEPLKEQYYRNDGNIERKITSIIHNNGGNIDSRGLDWGVIRDVVRHAPGYPAAVGGI